MSKMGLWHRVNTNPAKEELTELLVTGEDDESFEVIRDYISKEGGRKLVKNTGMTLAFLPFLLVGFLLNLSHCLTLARSQFLFEHTTGK